MYCILFSLSINNATFWFIRLLIVAIDISKSNCPVFCPQKFYINSLLQNFSALFWPSCMRQQWMLNSKQQHEKLQVVKEIWRKAASQGWIFLRARTVLFWNGLQYRHSDFKKFIYDDLATLWQTPNCSLLLIYQPEGMKGWVGLVGCLADCLPT